MDMTGSMAAAASLPHHRPAPPPSERAQEP